MSGFKAGVVAVTLSAALSGCIAAFQENGIVVTIVRPEATNA